MSKPNQASTRQPVSVCLDVAQVSRIDALAESSSTPWHKTTRAEVLRTLVNHGLGHMEEATRPRAKRRRSRSAASTLARRRAATH